MGLAGRGEKNPQKLNLMRECIHKIMNTKQNYMYICRCTDEFNTSLSNRKRVSYWSQHKHIGVFVH